MMVEQEIGIRNPFPGLRPFEMHESLIFFGRDGLTDVLLEKLNATRFVSVVGTSGTGKSSLVRAGLLPALRGGFLMSTGASWRIALFRPVNNPIGNLAQALLEAGIFPAEGQTDEVGRRAAIEQGLRHSSLGLIEVVRRARLSPYENVLIVVDQFEELYRFEPHQAVEHPKDEAAAFVKLLLEAAQEPSVPIYTILTMRSDYLGESAQFWGLPEAINKGQFLIPRMDDDERREAIEAPVKVFGAKFSAPLVNRLLNDAGDNPDHLPILQHALMRTWEYWQEHRDGSKIIGIEHYDNDEVGGMARALSIHADEAYDALSDAQKTIAKKMFKRLTEKGTGTRERRLPATVSEIKDITQADELDIAAVIEAFRKEGRSFLMPPAPKPLTPDTLIDISHESLIWGWERLKTWVDKEDESAKIFLRLVDDALRYPKATGLLTDPELQIALNWHDKQKPNEVWAKRYSCDFKQAMDYLEKSKQERERVEAQKEKQRRKSLIYVSVTAIVLFIFLILALAQWRAANRERKTADALRHDAEAAKQVALNAEKVALDERTKALKARDKAKTAETIAIEGQIKADKLAKQALAAQRKFEVQAKRGNLLEQGITSAMDGDIKAAVAKLKDLQTLYEQSHDLSKQITNQILIGNTILKSPDGSDTGEDALDSDAALKYLLKALSTSQKEGIKLTPSTWVNIGDNITIQSEELAALPFYEYAIGMMRDDKDAESKSDTLVKVADIYAKLGEKTDLTKAVEKYRQALTLIKNSSPEKKSAIYTELGDIYERQHKPDEAREAYHKAVEFATASGKHGAEGDALRKIGAVYLRADDYDKALDYYNQARAAYHVEGTPAAIHTALLGEAQSLSSIGLVYAHKGDKTQAGKYYEEALGRLQDPRVRRDHRVISLELTLRRRIAELAKEASQ